MAIELPKYMLIRSNIAELVMLCYLDIKKYSIINKREFDNFCIILDRNSIFLKK